MLESNIIQIKKIDSFLSFFISYMLPFLILNYFFIFYKNKYQNLIKDYPYSNGKYIKRFIFGAGLIPIFFIIIIFFLYKLGLVQ